MEGKTIGILGGMGPGATNYLFDLIIRYTSATRDRDHVPVIISSNPGIPDRTENILAGGSSPLPHIIREARRLEAAGADFIIMPCVTAHYYYPDFSQRVRIPFYHLIDETYHNICQVKPPLKKIGLLATDGTINTGIFQHAFSGLNIITPDSTGQAGVMEAIYGTKGIKAGFLKEPVETLLEVIESLKGEQIEGLVAGCTEISLALSTAELCIPLFDPLKIIALKAINQAGYEVK